MIRILPLLISLFAAQNLFAFDLPSLTRGQLPPVSGVPAPAPEKAADASCYASYLVNGAEVAVPHIGCGRNVIAALPRRESPSALAAKLRPAFGADASALPRIIKPASKAELELAAANPGAPIVSLNDFLPAGVSELFNREPNFGGPNCFNAAFAAAGLMSPEKLRHVGNPEADQLLSMYYGRVSPSSPEPGDILVLNGGDHGVYYLGGGLIFHKKSYLKHHIYRIARLEKAYYPEPFEWKPGPFDGGSPFNSAEEIKKTEAWRPNGAQYQFGQASADETAKVNAIIFLTEQIEKHAPNWALSKQMGYFTERLMEDLVSDWSAMGKSPNPVLRAYYRRLESFRDQANQSIETELLSSPHAQSNAYEILKGVWLPRNDYSRELVGRLLAVYGKDPGAAETVLDAIAANFERSPLKHIRDAARAGRSYGGQAVSYTSGRAAALAAMAGDLTQVNLVNGGMNGQDQYYFWGVPQGVRRVTPAQTGIMRHWTSNAQANGTPVVDLIVGSGVLKAGPRPYIVPESHRADYYSDLHGVFFTTPDFPPGQLWMGLTADSDYVDFTVDPGMGALYLAPGNYLFPCPLKVQGWIAEAYRKWKAGGQMPSGMELTFSHIDREGGLREAIDIPVTVVRYQKDGRVTVLRPDLLERPY